MQALERILAVVDVVAGEREPVSVSTIAKGTGLSLSTASRLTAEMTQQHVLIRTRAGTYLLGPRLPALLAPAYSHRYAAWRDIAEPQLWQLREATGETISLHLRTGALRVSIAVAQSLLPIARVVTLGEQLPLPESATGEVLLSRLSDGTLTQILGALGVSADRQDSIAQRIHAIRERGWAMADGVWVNGVTACSVPVAGSDPTIEAALTVSGPSSRFTAQKAMEALPTLVSSAEAIYQFMAGDSEPVPGPA